MSLHKEGEDLREQVFLFRCEVRYLLTILFIFAELDLVDDLERLETKRRERILIEYLKLVRPGLSTTFRTFST